MNAAQHAARHEPPDTSTRAFVKLGWPLFIANLALVGNGTIDTVMAGRLSATDLAAVAVGSISRIISLKKRKSRKVACLGGI